MTSNSLSPVEVQEIRRLLNTTSEHYDPSDTIWDRYGLTTDEAFTVVCEFFVGR